MLYNLNTIILIPSKHYRSIIYLALHFYRGSCVLTIHHNSLNMFLQFNFDNVMNNNLYNII